MDELTQIKEMVETFKETLIFLVEQEEKNLGIPVGTWYNYPAHKFDSAA